MTIIITYEQDLFVYRFLRCTCFKFVDEMMIINDQVGKLWKRQWWP
jgi:hypothetical protein